MVIHDLDPAGVAPPPGEEDAPAVVDTDAVWRIARRSSNSVHPASIASAYSLSASAGLPIDSTTAVRVSARSVAGRSRLLHSRNRDRRVTACGSRDPRIQAPTQRSGRDWSPRSTTPLRNRGRSSSRPISGKRSSSVSKQIFHRRRDQARVLPEPPELVPIAQQRQHPVAGQVGGRLVSRDQEQAQHIQRLAFRQAIAFVLRLHEGAEDVVPRLRPPGRDDLAEIRIESA